MKRLTLFHVAATLFVLNSNAQKIHYSVANAHSHNDYANKSPFTGAYNEQFGSMEADIFLWNDSLIVGHTTKDIPLKRTLQTLYLDPLLIKTKSNHGFPYADTSRSLQMLIDIKTTAIPTIQKLIDVLSNYKPLIQSKKIQFVITGNRPDPSAFPTYPGFIYFDGDPRATYTAVSLDKVALMSDDLKKYTRWNGEGSIPAADKLLLDSVIQKTHSLQKKIRFWDAPDIPNAWIQFVQSGVDYINTDHIEELSNFFKQQ